MSVAARLAAAKARIPATPTPVEVLAAEVVSPDAASVAPDGADIEGPYRYRLWRTLDAEGRGGTVVWVLLNPSTADAVEPDPTLTRCVGFSRDLGYGRVELVNLFAFRSTDPKAMEQVADPVGPRNDAAILAAVRGVNRVIVAWGAHPGTEPERRAAEVVRLLTEAGVTLWCLGRNAGGTPKHPLYLAKSTILEPFGALPAAPSGWVGLEPAETPVEVAIAQRPLSDPAVVVEQSTAGGVPPGVVGPVLPGGDDLRGRGGHGRSPGRRGPAAERGADASGPRPRGLGGDRSGGPSPAELTPASYDRCSGCGAAVRRVQTPWGALAPIGRAVVGALDSAAGDERVSVVHPGGISRCVVPLPGWSGPTVEGFELHDCGVSGG